MQTMMTDDQKRLAEDNIPFAVFIANKWRDRNTQLEYDDLRSLCFMGLCKAARAFDPQRGVTFATLAARCMDNEIKMNLRRKRIASVSLSSELSVDTEGNILEFLDTMTSEDHLQYDLIEDIESLKGIVPKLKLREREIIWLTFFNSDYVGHQERIANRVGITQSMVSRVKAGALKKIRDFMEHDSRRDTSA